VFSHLQIYDPRERLLVGAADAVLGVSASVARLVPRRAPVWPPRRILLMRLERIGDLLMSAPAIAAVREYAPGAKIDLVVGSWNAPLASLIPGIDTIETLDATWLARGATRDNSNQPTLIRHALSWRARHYDLAINFEGDIRSHALMALSGSPVRAGFDMAGGGPLLTHRVTFKPDEHTTTNAWRLVQAAFERSGAAARAARGATAAAPARETARPANAHAAAADVPQTDRAVGPFSDAPFRLVLPADARARAAALVVRHGRRMLIGVHVSGGRAIKQWPPARFAEVAARLAQAQDAVLLLTGTTSDRPIVQEMRAALPGGIEVLDLVGEVDLPLLAATLERCGLLVTGDTGPMHLAAFVGTPIVAIFGPSDPVRYAPLAAPHRVVRIDLPCAPCNRIRLPPARCQGHTPDCLAGVTVDAVCDAARDLLAASPSRDVSPVRGSS